MNLAPIAYSLLGFKGDGIRDIHPPNGSLLFPCHQVEACRRRKKITSLSEQGKVTILCPFAWQVHLPFAVVGSTEEVKIGNKMAKARQYPWGVVQGMCTAWEMESSNFAPM